MDFARSDILAIRLAALLGLTQRLGDLDSEQRTRVRADARALADATVPSEYQPTIDLCRALHGDKASIPDLIRRVPSSPSASLALGLLLEAQPTVIDALRSAVEKTNRPAIRTNAAIALTLLRQRNHIAWLIRRLKTSRSFLEQSTIVSVLGRIGDQTAADPLLDVYLDPRRPAALRAAAAQALGRLADLRRTDPFLRDSTLFVPGLAEPVVEGWLAQR